MNCYQCQKEMNCEGRSVCAVCQHCGAAMCDRHLVTTQPIVGMASGGSHALICTQCHGLSAPFSKASSTQQHQQPASTPQWLRTRLFCGIWWFRKNKDVTLPEPEQAVALVEQFLKRQLKP